MTDDVLNHITSSPKLAGELEKAYYYCGRRVYGTGGVHVGIAMSDGDARDFAAELTRLNLRVAELEKENAELKGADRES